MKNLWIFNKGRLAILLKLLGCDSARGCDLRECLKMKKPLLSHHIGILRKKGLIEEKKEGREKYYRISPRKRNFVKNVVKIIE